jgi:hypothetical protein
MFLEKRPKVRFPYKSKAAFPKAEVLGKLYGHIKGPAHNRPVYVFLPCRTNVPPLPPGALLAVSIMPIDIYKKAW